MNVGFVIGHTRKNKGFKSNVLNEQEFDFNFRVAEILCIDYEFPIFEHNYKISSYTKRQKDTAKRTKKYNFDLIIELHFNGFDNPNANGCECLYYKGNLKAKKHAEKFINFIVEEYGTNKRKTIGRNFKSKSRRGVQFLYNQKADALIFEPFFGSNKEALKFKDCERYAKTINEFIKSIS